MRALAFIDGRGVLVVADKDGRKHDVTTSSGARLLPAWSPDGARIVWLEKSTRGFDLRVVNVIVHW